MGRFSSTAEISSASVTEFSHSHPETAVEDEVEGGPGGGSTWENVAALRWLARRKAARRKERKHRTPWEWVRDMAKDPRTERSLRFALFSLPALYLSLHPGSINTVKPYIIGIMYVIFSALVPPFIAGASAVTAAVLGGVPVVMGGMVTASFAAGGSVDPDRAKLVGVIVFSLMVALVAPLKIGRFGAITSIGCLVIVYPAVIAFLYGLPIIADGVSGFVPMQTLLYLMKHPEKMQGFPPSIQHLMGALGPAITMYANNTNLPPTKKFMILNETVAAGAPLNLTLDHSGIAVNMSGGSWVVHTMWEGDGSHSLVGDLTINLLLAAAIYAASQLCWPQRYGKSLVRRAIGGACRSVAVNLNKTCLKFMTPGGPRIGVNDSAGDVTAASLIGDKGESGESVSDECTTLIAAMNMAEKVTPVGALEPSIFNPGPLVLYWPEYKNLLQAINQCAVHIGNMYEALPTQSESGQLVMSMRDEVVGLVGVGRDVLTLAADLIELKPALWGKRVAEAEAIEERLDRSVESLTAAWIQTKNGIMKKIVTPLLTTKHPLGPQDVMAVEAFIGELTEAAHIWPMRVATCAKALSKAQRTIHPLALPVSLFGWLAVALVVIALPFQSLFRLVTPWRWYWAGPNAWWSSSDARYVIKFAAAIILLVALGSAFGSINHLQFVSTSSVLGDYSQYVTTDYQQTSMFMSWTSLGFITCFYFTIDGTVHRAALRILGTLAGALNGWVALRACDGSDAGIIAWLAVSYAVVTWFSGNPENALYGFHPSWGYAAQLFTYTCTIIALEGHTQDSKDEIALERLIAMLLGITLALVMAHIFPTRAETEARKEIGLALDECVVAVNVMVTAYTSQQPHTPALHSKTHKHLDQAGKHLTKTSRMVSEANLFKELPLYHMDKEIPRLAMDVGALARDCRGLLETIYTPNPLFDQKRAAVPDFTPPLISQFAKAKEGESTEAGPTPEEALNNLVASINKVSKCLVHVVTCKHTYHVGGTEDKGHGRKIVCFCFSHQGYDEEAADEIRLLLAEMDQSADALATAYARAVAGLPMPRLIETEEQQSQSSPGQQRGSIVSIAGGEDEKIFKALFHWHTVAYHVIKVTNQLRLMASTIDASAGAAGRSGSTFSLSQR